MPIYAYKCSACGFAKDALQKLSDPPLTVCPECGQAAFSKQVTAAGFQLKGSGWYVTDFRNNGNPAPATGVAKPAGDASSAAAPAASASASSGSSDGGSSSSSASTPAATSAPKPVSGGTPST